MSTRYAQKGFPIMAGYAWTQRVKVTSGSVVFPSGAALTAHVRPSRTAEAFITLTTANGGIVRVTDTEIDLKLTAAQSATCAPGTVVLDIARTDATPNVHFGFSLTAPVIQPVTRLSA